MFCVLRMHSYFLVLRATIKHDNFNTWRKIAPAPNSDGLIKCLRQRQDSFSVNPNIYALKLCSIYKILCNRTVSSTWTASLALSADALVPRFLLAT